MPESSARILVLGLGNDILTDDAVGLKIADAVRERLADDPRIEVKSTTEMGLALLDEIAGRSAAILIDSVQTGRAPPGHLHEFDDAALTGVASTVPHMLGVGETLALGRMMGLTMPQQVRIFAIEVADPFTLGTEMTAAVRDAVVSAAGKIAATARALVQTAASDETASGTSRTD